MKDANENILRVLVNNVQESVDFLLKSLTCLDRDINIPTSECFTNLNSETGNYDLIWTKSSVYTLNMLKCFVNSFILIIINQCFFSLSIHSLFAVVLLLFYRSIMT